MALTTITRKKNHVRYARKYYYTRVIIVKTRIKYDIIIYYTYVSLFDVDLNTYYYYIAYVIYTHNISCTVYAYGGAAYSLRPYLHVVRFSRPEQKHIMPVAAAE